MSHEEKVKKIHKSKFKFTVRDRNNKEASGYSETIRAAKSAARNHFRKLMTNYAQANT